MKPSEIRALLRVRRPEPSATARRLARSHTIWDLRREAARVLPRVVFDYVEGGADAEETIAANVDSYRSVQLIPLTLTGNTAPDPGVDLLGRRLPLPMALAPTGYSRLMHSDGELAVARAAARAGLPYSMSTVASASVAELGQVPELNLWAQLYVLKDRDLTWDLLDRMATAGASLLAISVDTNVAGFRSRDVRNGLTIPPQLSPSAVIDIVGHPGYWWRFVQAPAMTFPNLPASSAGGSIGSITGSFESRLDWDDVAEVRRRWPGTLLLKGPVAPADAAKAIELGIDGVHLSNHGGRQLDRCISPLELLPEVRAAVGPKALVFVDSGVRHGTDLLVAHALGADLALIGRAYLYGLAVAGEEGVARAISIFDSQLRRTMHLLGVTSLAEARENAHEILRRKEIH